MPSDPPVDFQQLAQGARGQSGSDYPYAIKATDLMKNFVFATPVFDEGLYDDTTGMQGHAQRRLRLKRGTTAGQLAYWDGSDWAPLSLPGSGRIHVLASNGGVPYWIETESCD
jgi:hypothetical protein